jgi:hypothetical protein
VSLTARINFRASGLFRRASLLEDRIMKIVNSLKSLKGRHRESISPDEP